VRLENLDHAVEVFVLPRLEFVAAGADGAGGRRRAEQADLLGRLVRQVEQFLLEDALDAMPAGVHRADFLHLPGGLDDAAERVVDHRRRAAGLGDNHVTGHGSKFFMVNGTGVRRATGRFREG